jgi:AraC-like DNA-binding protein
MANTFIIMDNYFLARRTESLDQLEEWLRPASDEIKIIPPNSGSTDIHLNLAMFKRLAFFSIESNAPFCVDIDVDRWHVSLTLPLGRGFQANVNGRMEIFSGTHAHLLSPQDNFRFRTQNNNNTLVFNVDRKVVSEYSEKLRQGNPLEITKNTGVYFVGPHGAGFRRLIDYLWGELRHGGESLQHHLFATELEETLIVSYMLALEENFNDLSRHEYHAVAPETIKRVEEYLLGHLTEPVSLADLAAVSGLPIRTLSRNFKKYFGASPMQFLRERRFEAAQSELSRGSVETHSVTETAMRYGFSHFGKFAKEYRQIFHELPSETLKRRYN